MLICNAYEHVFIFSPMSSRFISYAKTPRARTRTQTEKMYERRFVKSEMNEVFLSAGKDSL